MARQVRLWLEPLNETMFLERKREKILDAMKGQEPERNLITLLPTVKLRDKFHENIKSYMKVTFKEKILNREEMEHLLVRKILEQTNPNSEYDFLLLHKVGQNGNIFDY